MPKLDPTLKAAWLENLESGKYEQAHCFMKQDNAFCCLGVLRETMHQQGMLTQEELERAYELDNGALTLFEVEKLNGAFGGTASKIFGGLPNRRTLSSINDNSDSFAETIEAIEEFL